MINSTHLEEDFNAVDEEENDDDEHENGVTPVEDVAVKVLVFVLDPDEKELRREKGVRDDVEDEETEERFG